MNSPTPLWGNLRPGNHIIGSQIFITQDPNRRYEPPCLPPLPRPMIIRVWYPTPAPPTVSPMLYGNYLKFPDAAPPLQDFIEQLNQFALNKVCEEEMGKVRTALTAAEATTFQTLLQAPTPSHPDAPPLEQTFPLLIYHQGLGGTIVDNIPLLEYIASHGYIVATSTFHPAHGLCLGVESNLNNSIQDIACVIQTLSQRYLIDITRIALIGHSYGASAALGFAFEAQANIKAVISLDSTREWNAAHDHLYSKIEQRLAAAERFTIPLMILTKATPAPHFQPYEKLSYADRYYLVVQHLEHNDFVTPGATVQTLSEDSPSETPIQQASKVVCESVLTFLNHYFEEPIRDSQSLVEQWRSLDQVTQCLSIQKQDAAPLPITEKQLIEIFMSRGIFGFEDWSQQAVQQSSTIDPKILIKVGYPLEERGLYQEAIALYQYITQKFPNISEAYEALGDLYRYQLGDYTEALLAYQATLEALPRDPSLSEIEKAYRQEYLIEDIASCQSKQDSGCTT